MLAVGVSSTLLTQCPVCPVEMVAKDGEGEGVHCGLYNHFTVVTIQVGPLNAISNAQRKKAKVSVCVCVCKLLMCVCVHVCMCVRVCVCVHVFDVCVFT